MPLFERRMRSSPSAPGLTVLEPQPAKLEHAKIASSRRPARRPPEGAGAIVYTPRQ